VVKKIVLVPPNGWLLIHDFSLHRIGMYLKKLENVTTIIVKIDNKKRDVAFDDGNYVDEVINVTTEQELLKKIEELKPDLIFHRSWMLAYSFAAKLVERFENVVVNIKDWNFTEKDKYEFIYPNHGDDFEAIEYIFKNAKNILSHFTNKQSKIWAKKYDVDSKKFLFFPEYCNEDFFLERKLQYKNVKIVFAGSINQTTLPEQLFPWKSHLRSVSKLTKQNIRVDFVLPEAVYENIFNDKNNYFDWQYENKFNKNINIIKGTALSPIKLAKYHFCFFELETSGENKELYKYAVVSKFAFYLEACLPILVNEDFKSISKIIRKHNLGIVFSNKDLDNFNNVLKISQKEYNQMVKNISEFRKTYTYKNNDKKMKNLLKNL
jgi:hypothetical protein